MEGPLNTTGLATSEVAGGGAGSLCALSSSCVCDWTEGTFDSETLRLLVFSDVFDSNCCSNSACCALRSSRDGDKLPTDVSSFVGGGGGAGASDSSGSGGCTPSMELPSSTSMSCSTKLVALSTAAGLTSCGVGRSINFFRLYPLVTFSPRDLMKFVFSWLSWKRGTLWCW